MHAFLRKYTKQILALGAVLLLLVGTVVSLRQCRRVEPTVSDGTPPTTLLTAAQTTDATATTGDMTHKTTDAAPATTQIGRAHV